MFVPTDELPGMQDFELKLGVTRCSLEDEIRVMGETQYLDTHSRLEQFVSSHRLISFPPP